MAQGRQHLTDEEKTRVRILANDAKQSISQICKTTGYSRHQVRRAIDAVQGPRKRKGPSPVLGPEEEAELVKFITASQRNRFLPWTKVAKEFAGGNYGFKAVRNALQRLGYTRDAAGTYLVQGKGSR
ncbi:hypothetical protein EV127DRAFT_213548 [Xylaria flabelliformis]|nr:hypothetical protein EV127DRAFT_213548 [Xylaria flabelliformis]KAI0854984.1 hypothetical protein F4860DRAFT_69653 [Xylaria cubensis]